MAKRRGYTEVVPISEYERIPRIIIPDPRDEFGERCYELFVEEKVEEFLLDRDTLDGTPIFRERF